jgi:hypothetical protein
MTSKLPKPLNFDDLASMSSDRERGKAVMKEMAQALLAAVGAPPLMTVAQAADAALVSAQCIRNWRRRCPAIGVRDPVTGHNLVDRAALKDYLLGRHGVLPPALRDE